MRAIKCVIDKHYLFQNVSATAGKEENVNDCMRTAILDSLKLKHQYLYFSLEGTKNFLLAIHHENFQNKWDAEIETEVTGFQEWCENNILREGIKKYNYFSLGSGDGRKDTEIIHQFAVGKRYQINYIPIDFSYFLLRTAICKVKGIEADIPIFPYNIDFIDIGTECKNELNKLHTDDTVSIFALLGNTIGNYKERKLLNSISSIIKPGNYLLVGYKLKTEEKIVNDGDRDFLRPALKLLNIYHSPDRLLPYYTLQFDAKKGIDANLSDIPGSESLFYTYQDQYTLSFTTSYDKEQLKAFICDNFDFEFIYHFDQRGDNPIRQASLFKKIETWEKYSNKALQIIDFWKNRAKDTEIKLEGIVLIEQMIAEGRIKDEDVLNTLIKSSTPKQFEAAIKEVNKIIRGSNK